MSCAAIPFGLCSAARVCRASYVFDEAAGLPAQLLGELPECFSVRDAVLGVRYDNFRISAHAPASLKCA